VIERPWKAAVFCPYQAWQYNRKCALLLLQLQSNLSMSPNGLSNVPNGNEGLNVMSMYLVCPLILVDNTLPWPLTPSSKCLMGADGVSCDLKGSGVWGGLELSNTHTHTHIHTQAPTQTTLTAEPTEFHLWHTHTCTLSLSHTHTHTVCNHLTVSGKTA